MQPTGSGTREPEPVEKVSTGVEGIDEITRGGLPRGRTTLVLGTPGAGKTILALQTLVNGARRHGEAGIFVAFEESSRRIVANAATFGWDLPGLQENDLFFLDAYLSPQVVQSGSFDLAGILAALQAKATEMGARRIVFDGIDVLLTLLDDPVAERREVYRLHEWLMENDLTGIVTAKSGFEHPLSTGRFDFMQFMADCVILLHHRVEDRVSLRGARVLKYRGSGFSANEFPLVIGREGVEVATFGPDELDFAVSNERVPTGIERLDAMLGGGYYRGSSVLVTGSPGTAKTTLGAAFAHATCRQGERALYVSFDEPAGQIVRNLASVGIDLEPHVRAGSLRMYSVRTEVRSAEEHLVVLQRLMREHEPHALVVDPVSALTKSGGRIPAVDSSVRLLDFARARGITSLCTSLVGGRGTVEESTDVQISTIADTWLHLAYVAQGGERNRALSIVKSRGMSHSSQIRELVLADEGLTLADVYVEGGEVLMGTARYEREARERADEERLRREAEERRRELVARRQDLEARIAELRREADRQDAEMERLEGEQKARRSRRVEVRGEVRRLRGGDAAGAGS